MELLNRLLYHQWVFIPLVGSLVGLSVFLISDRLIAFLEKKSLGSKAEVIRYMRLMTPEVDEKRVTAMMLLLSFGLGALMFLLLWPNVLLALLVAAGVTAVGWTLPLLLVKNSYDRRCGQFVDQMVDALTILANGIKAGSNPQESMRRVCDIMTGPVKAEFNQVLFQMSLGDSFENALNDLATRIPRPDVQMFVTAINILKETGGDLGETFETIVVTIRERQKVEKKIEALTAQGIMQGLIISLAPFMIMGVMMVSDPKFIAPLFNTTLGWVLLLVMFSLQIIGGIVIRRIVTIKV